jgi:hypothetical protein
MMKKYLALLLFTALLLPLVVAPNKAEASREGSPVDSTTSPNPFDHLSLFKGQQFGGRQAATKPVVSQAVGFAESPSVSALKAGRREDTVKSRRFEEEARDKNGKNSEAIRHQVPGTFAPDGALQKSNDNQFVAPTVLPSPTVQADGITGQNNFDAGLGRFSPPDPNGDVGPNHYVQTSNSMFRVYDKNGVALTAPTLYSSLFSALPAPCNASNDGDPIALYDSLADRWMLSQFCLPSYPSPPYHQLIAISKTPDPVGAYYLYDFLISAGNNELNDYPHIGVWGDGYYMSDNQFLNGDAFNGAGIFAFDRAKMLAGDPTASFIYFNLNQGCDVDGNNCVFGGMLPADLDGVSPPPAGEACPFAMFSADEYGNAGDGMRLFNFHVDFTTPANSTFTERAESAANPNRGLIVANFDPREVPSLSRRNITQPPPTSTTAKLDAIMDRLMHRLAYRNFGTHESLVVTHTVNALVNPAYQAAIRYYEFRRALPGGSYLVNEQATFAGAPNDTVHRWMGSAAMNAAGDIAVGYSASNTSVFPSLRYAARFASDPPNGLAQGEQTMTAGTGVQTSTGNRWGDYSSLSVDPSDDCSFWYTGEYYTSASQASSAVGWLTRFGKFGLGGNCTPSPRGTIQGTVTNSVTGMPILNATVKTSNGYLRTTGAPGTYSMSPVAPDTYSMTASAPGYPSVTVNGVTVSNGGTTVQNFALVPSPLLMTAGSALTMESCPTAVLDPGESVTVNLSLKNTGTADTAALVGTLQATGGVTNPGAPQSYGVLTAGGAAVTKSFTFTVSPSQACGSIVTATLALVDGATNLGVVTYNFQVGTLVTSFTQNLDAVTAPALPAGWTTAATGVEVPWVTSTTSSDTAPNNAFAPNSTDIGNTELVTPAIPIATASGQLTFRNLFNMEASSSTASRGFDGMVLEISIPSVSGGAYQDILAAGGSFVSGGYTRTIDATFGNPIAGRQAWSGLSAGTTAAPTYITTVVTLPAAANGQNIRLKWRVGTDDSFAASGLSGVRIDSISLAGSYQCCSNPLPPYHPAFDYDGDNKSDLSNFTGTTGLWDAVASGNSSGPHVQRLWGATSLGDVIVPADYDGDGKSDFAVYRNGIWYVSRNSGGDLNFTWGLSTDIPVPADYDNDGKADIAVYRPTEGSAQGLWYVLKSSSNYTTFDVAQFGASTDKPVVGDYNGDGKADYAVIRRGGGAMTWYILYNGGTNFAAAQWGLDTGDIAVPADYDGDRKTDIAVWRPSNGTWYVVRSGGGFVGSQWGSIGDIPVAADYDGDLKADIGVYRPSDNTWYTGRSQSGSFSIDGFGDPGTTPVPSAYNR